MFSFDPLCFDIEIIYMTYSLLFLHSLVSAKFPPRIRIVSVQMTSIELDWEEWTTNIHDISLISHYILKVCSSSNCTLYDLGNPGSFTFTATNLEPATVYSISISAMKLNGIQEPYTPSVQVSTLPKGMCKHHCAYGHYFLY